jgi:hypothetical protein
MTNYFSEALALARAGVVSMLTDAPARGDGVISEINQTKLDDSQRFQADVVVSLRMVGRPCQFVSVNSLSNPVVRFKIAVT